MVYTRLSNNELANKTEMTKLDIAKRVHDKVTWLKIIAESSMKKIMVLLQIQWRDSNCCQNNIMWIYQNIELYFETNYQSLGFKFRVLKLYMTFSPSRSDWVLVTQHKPEKGCTILLLRIFCSHYRTDSVFVWQQVSNPFV